MNNWHKYDNIAPKIRAQVTKVKYGSATPLHLVATLREEADKVERDYTLEQQAVNQQRLDI